MGNQVNFWSGVDSVMFASHFLVGNDAVSSTLNPVYWTLVVEIWMALVFIPLVTIYIKFGWKHFLILTLSISLISVILYKVFGGFLFFTASFVILFSFGVLIHSIGPISSRLGFGLFWSGLLGVIIYPVLINIIDVNSTYMGFVAYGFLSSLLILGAINSVSISRHFERRFLLFLGKISFSLYLTHCLLIGISVSLFGHQLSFMHFTVLILLSFVVAIVFYYLVELPSLRLSRFARRLNF